MGLHCKSSTDPTCPTNGTGSVAHPPSTFWVTLMQFPQSPLANRPSSVGDQSKAKPSCCNENAQRSRMSHQVVGCYRVINRKKVGLRIRGRREGPREIVLTFDVLNAGALGGDVSSTNATDDAVRLVVATAATVRSRLSTCYVVYSGTVDRLARRAHQTE